MKEKNSTLDPKQNKPLISIILPSLNEEKSIKKVIEEIKAIKLPTNEIIVVDGCSTDATIDIVKNLNVKIVIEPKRGYGNAIYRGIDAAKGKIIVIMDADHTYPASFIPQIISPLIKNEADLVLGNRLKNIKLESMKISHIFGNVFLTLIFNFLFHSKIRDTQTGFSAFRKKTFEKMNIKSKGIFLPTEILIRALKLQLRIEEKSIIYRPRLGRSKLSPIRDGLIIFLKMLINRIS